MADVLTSLAGGFGRTFRLAAVASLAVVVAGCAPSQKVARVDKLSGVGSNPKVLLMRPDVTVNLMTASGMTEPQAEWTEAARANFLAAVEEFGKTRRIEVVRMSDDAVPTESEVAHERLHAAVGNTILLNYYGPQKLPTKAGGFDWSLGNGVSGLKDRYGADYALFSYYRDTKSSGGRVAMFVLFAAAGIAVPMGGQGGFASLVDLTTGDVVWFNLVPAGSGDLRMPEGAQSAVRQLFSGLPER